ncbi:MAG: SMP-30/gluconolactonase/LRE family protein [Hyphomicrobiales bacterium]|nr:SMP-30/gluconolactonase/LRE family protein [Hyphomicrobiales bacterium]
MRKCLAFLAALAMVPCAHAADGPLLTGLQYPEGVLVHRGVVYFAEMDADRIMASADGETFREAWREDGCGPTSLAPLAEARFLITCHMGGGLRLWDAAANATIRAPEPDAAPVMRGNDSVSDGAGGAFFSDSGEFAPDAARVGRVMHYSAAGYRTVASGLAYANGVAYDAATDALYVSEHLGRRILRIAHPLDASRRKVETFWDYAQKPCAEAGAKRWLFGPDGLELRPGGGLFVAIYGGEAVYELDAAGGCAAVRRLPAVLVTSSAADEARGALWIVSPGLISDPRHGGLFRQPLRRAEPQ